jgi:hypothetical protein
MKMAHILHSGPSDVEVAAHVCNNGLAKAGPPADQARL